MKKKLLFLAATALLMVNVVFIVKGVGQACVSSADCPGDERCYDGVCIPSVVIGGDQIRDYAFTLVGDCWVCLRYESGTYCPISEQCCYNQAPYCN